MAAVGELTQEYGTRVHFNVVSAEDTAKRQDEIVEYGFADQKHGLVAFTAAGEPLVKIQGHQFGRDEIQAATEAVLAAD